MYIIRDFIELVFFEKCEKFIFVWLEIRFS